MSAKDARLYAKFTLDFPDHPKIKPLSDAAFRALHEMISYSCRLQTDGFISRKLVGSRGEAGASWCFEVVRELCDNDDENPSLVEVPNGYLLHDFSDHQLTKADIDARRQAKQTAGRKGGVASGVTRRSKREAGASTLVEANAKQNEADRDRDRDRDRTTNFVGSSARTPARAATNEASALVSQIIPKGHPRAVVTGLRDQASALIADETEPDLVADALRLWLERGISAPSILPSLVSDVIKQRSPQTNRSVRRGTDSKIVDWQQLRQRMTDQPNTIQGAIEQ